MKKIIFLSSLLLSIFSYAQCHIVGQSTLGENQTASYTFENENAQCENCHLWAISNTNAKLVGDIRTNSINVNALAIGKSILSLSVLTSKGMSQCIKEIEIVKPNTSSNNNFFQQSPTASQVAKSDCNIDVNSFKEVKFTPNSVSIIPNIAGKEHDFLWTATYANGEKRTSNYTISQFEFTKDNKIRTISVEVKQGSCIRTISKNYEENFWKYF